MFEPENDETRILWKTVRKRGIWRERNDKSVHPAPRNGQLIHRTDDVQCVNVRSLPHWHHPAIFGIFRTCPCARIHRTFVASSRACPHPSTRFR